MLDQADDDHADQPGERERDDDQRPGDHEQGELQERTKQVIVDEPQRPQRQNADPSADDHQRYDRAERDRDPWPAQLGLRRGSRIAKVDQREREQS